MDSEFFSYEKWVEEALRDVIKRALQQTAAEGLAGDHHFFITFLTGHDDVNIPDHLRAEHPEEMTIVLQHQYQNLEVSDTGFNVNLSFSGRSCYLAIPFAAVTSFADPAVNFVLQLKMAKLDEESGLSESTDDSTGPVALEALAVAEPLQFNPDQEPDEDTDEAPNAAEARDDDKMGEVIALDTFRKK